MSMDADLIVDRRLTRRKLFVWRLVAVVAVVIAIAVTGYFAGGDRLLGKGRPHIARISVTGMILSDRRFEAMLGEIADNDAVRGVVLSLDSPGGTTVGGEQLYLGLRRLSGKKPVVATMGTLATSAAYMAAIGTDHIIAERTSITGSIGVLFQYGNVGPLMDRIGVEVKTVKSAPLKAEPSPFTWPEQPGAAEMIGRLVNDTYQWFVDIVAERRALDRGRVIELADGSIYSGRQALEAGLIDEIGGEREAIAWMEEKRGVATELPVVDWRPAAEFDRFSLTSSLAGMVGGLVGIDLSALWGQPSLDGLVSVWHPQALGNH